MCPGIQAIISSEKGRMKSHIRSLLSLVLPLIPILDGIGEGDRLCRIHRNVAHKSGDGGQAASVFRPFHNHRPVDVSRHLDRSEAIDGLREDQAQLVSSFVD